MTFYKNERKMFFCWLLPYQNVFAFFTFIHLVTAKSFWCALCHKLALWQLTLVSLVLLFLKCSPQEVIYCEVNFWTCLVNLLSLSSAPLFFSSVMLACSFFVLSSTYLSMAMICLFIYHVDETLDAVTCWCLWLIPHKH